MPSTVGGLFIFLALLTPGFLHYVQRRRRIPQRKLSGLVEVATLTTVSVAFDLLAVLAFALARWILPDHTPDIEALVTQGLAYAAPRLGYLLVWGAGVFAFACILAVAWGSRRQGWFITPVLVDVSTWYHEFEKAPEDTEVFVGCDLRDGRYISGYLDWYNTDVDEVADRDIALNRVQVIVNGNSVPTGFEKIILSARDIRAMHVSYIGASSQHSIRSNPYVVWIIIINLAACITLAALLGLHS